MKKKNRTTLKKITTSGGTWSSGFKIVMFPVIISPLLINSFLSALAQEK